ncbi:GNAT family N-acetyltransferase [Microbacterium sp. ZXX196]|uniref:GNAT family N-acetyltransferase n=1 Tax=Microbacterium sp. ZXX196 TaxID=2609291 RepID=UPI001327E71E|nr:GNAT family N-acetyltransferase [Microbacterium sp. ZXX196]
MGDPVPLRTPRLFLTAPTPADADAIYEACQDPLIQRFTTVPAPYTREDAAVFVGSVVDGWESGAELVWAVRSEGALAGMVGLHRVANGAAELGYWASPAARGAGLITEAARAVVEFAFGPMRLRRLEWHAVVGNDASARVAQKLGFQFEGVRRQALHGDPPFDGWIAGLLATDPRTPTRWDA